MLIALVRAECHDAGDAGDSGSGLVNANLHAAGETVPRAGRKAVFFVFLQGKMRVMVNQAGADLVLAQGKQ
jgi:hypothetical protein